jgi:hypothetical protein
MSTRKRLVTLGAAVATTAVCGLAGVASSAFADSSSIAGAPTIVPGQTFYGNLTSVTPDSQGCANAYWLLPETAGDAVTINWEAQNSTHLAVYPSGTNDFDVDQTTPLVGSDLNENNEDSLPFRANSDGVLPLLFQNSQFDVGNCGTTSGPYSFTVLITHGMVVTIGALSTTRSGVVASIKLATPDGTPLGANITGSLQVSANGVPWTTIGQAAAAGGTATIRYMPPSTLDGKRVRFRAVGSGAGYRTVDSASQSVTIPAPACVVPKVLGEKLATAKKALRAAHCELGKVSYKKTKRHNWGRVLNQSAKVRKKLADDAKIRVTVGRK